MSGAPRADARRRAAAALDRVLAAKSAADAYLAAAERGLDERDRRLTRELVLGTLRWLRRLDHVLEAASGRELRQIRGRLMAPLRVGLYQLLFLDRVPAFAAVDRAVREARRRAGRGGGGFVNAVLRKVAARPGLDAWPVQAGDLATRLAIETSHPDFLVRRWLERFGEDATCRLLDASNHPRPIWLLAMDDPETLRAELAVVGVETASSTLAERALEVLAGDPFATAAYERGAFYAQDAASQAAALVPPPRAGERVLDAAAAPGGKGFTLCAREPTLAVTAGDRSLARLVGLRDNQLRLRRPTPLSVLDAVEPPFDGCFDRVVADLPCSGSGTLSRHPELKWRVSAGEIDRLAARGLEMLRGLASAVGPGGLLVAITCSLEREENEDVMARLLAERPDLSRVDLAAELEPPSRDHVFAAGAWRLPATDRHDGFTVHVVRRS